MKCCLRYFLLPGLLLSATGALARSVDYDAGWNAPPPAEPERFELPFAPVVPDPFAAPAYRFRLTPPTLPAAPGYVDVGLDYLRHQHENVSSMVNI